MSVEISSATFSECVSTGLYKKIIVCFFKVLNWALREISKNPRKILTTNNNILHVYFL